METTLLELLADPVDGSALQLVGDELRSDATFTSRPSRGCSMVRPSGSTAI